MYSSAYLFMTMQFCLQRQAFEVDKLIFVFVFLGQNSALLKCVLFAVIAIC